MPDVRGWKEKTLKLANNSYKFTYECAAIMHRRKNGKIMQSNTLYIINDVLLLIPIKSMGINLIMNKSDF